MSEYQLHEFWVAVQYVFKERKRMRRTNWPSSVYVLTDDEKLCLRGYNSNGPDDGKSHPWIITSEDYFADDWEIVE